MIKLIVVGTIVLLCGLLGWEINKRRALEDLHARERVALMKLLEESGGTEAVIKGLNILDPANAPRRIVLPKNMDSIRIEGNVFENKPPLLEEE